jgi:hypothetical protein
MWRRRKSIDMECDRDQVKESWVEEWIGARLRDVGAA